MTCKPKEWDLGVWWITETFCIDEEQNIEILEAFNPEKIVEKQNEASGEHGEGYIWVLNMSVLFAAEYSPHYFFENIACNIT